MQSKDQETKESKSVASQAAPVRLRKPTYKKLQRFVAKANAKKDGKRITADQVINLSLDMLTDEHIDKLQQQSLSAQDWFERGYRAYCKENNKISRDEYFRKVLAGEINVEMRIGESSDSGSFDMSSVTGHFADDRQEINSDTF